MASTAPVAGYKPDIHMPIIAPPAQGAVPATHYAAVLADVAITVTPVDGSGAAVPPSTSSRVKIAVSPPPPASPPKVYNQLFAMTGGMVMFIPSGKPLPLAGAPPSPGAGTLVLQCWKADVAYLKKVLPPGVRPPTRILYLNVDPLSVMAALMPTIYALHEKVLKGAWDLPAPPADKTAMASRYAQRLLKFETAVFVRPGAPVGKAALAIPGNPASGHEVTLACTDATGADMSPFLHLRTMPNYGGARWKGHPVAAKLATWPVLTNIYLAFEVWNEGTGKFEALPAGVTIGLIKDDPSAGPNQPLATESTDGQGRVHFNNLDLKGLAGTDPDIYFLAWTSGITHAGHTLPPEWSTKGWKATNGQPGNYLDFNAAYIGAPQAPLVFRIGLDFHLALAYWQADFEENKLAPKGVPITICSAGSTLPTEHWTLKTDEKGQVHGVLFNIKGDENVYFTVKFEIEDPGIKLPKARVDMNEPAWSTSYTDADKTPTSYYPRLNRTSIGTASTPALLRCTVGNRNVALYFLTILRELQTFFYDITNGDWNGVQSLTFFPSAIFTYSWPLGTVNISPADHWDRSTILHEIGHQVLWKNAQYTNAGIAAEWGWGGELHKDHSTNSILNSQHALMEGWSEFIELIFGSTTPFDLSSIVDVHGDPKPGNLGVATQDNRGEEIEGAFANGLWEILVLAVITSGWGMTVPLSQPLVPESQNGESTAGPWIQDPAVRARFRDMIWKPLKALGGSNNPATTHMIAEIQNQNAIDWPMLRAILQQYNMAFP